jgi:hypothetical protein
MHGRAAALAILATAAAAQASSVTNEVIANTTQATDANPQSGTFTNALNASFDLTDEWALNAGLALTLEGQTAAASRFGQGGSAVTLLTAGADWSATESLTVGANLVLSPRSTQFAGTQVTIDTASGDQQTGDALVRSQISQVGAGVDVAWDSLGVSDLEWSLDLGVDYSHYAVDQSISEIRVGTRTETAGTLLADCQAHPRRCNQSLLTVLRNIPVQQDFERISASATAILFRDTDLTLDAAGYVYQQDPAGVSYFGLAAAGRGPEVPIAPLRYLVRPQVQHRFGDFSARLWLEAGEYVSGTGQGTTGIGTRLQYRFSKAWRGWVRLSGRRDVDDAGNATRSGTISAGVGYRW